MSNEDDMSKSLELATRLIDELYRLRPPRDEFNQLATEAARELRTLLSTSDNDKRAEREYQSGRLSELAGETNVFGDADGRLSMAKEYYENAVEYSKKGAGINLAKYEEDLATFLRDHPNVKKIGER